MDAAITDHPTLPTGNANAVDTPPHRGYDDPLQSPVRLPASAVAKRRIRKVNALGSPARRSPRLSCALPPQPPVECQDTRNTDETGDDESGSVDDVARHLSREDTPENDCLPPDEPSTVLADRIMRAQDNPSPPPQDLAYPGICYLSEKDDHLLPGLSAPPSPFRPINLLERLNQLSFPPFDLSHSPGTSTLDDRPEVAESGINSPRSGVISHEPCSPLVTSVPVKGVPQEDLVSVDTTPFSSTKCTVNDPPSRSSKHACETANLADSTGIDPPFEPDAGLHGQSKTSSCDSEVLGSSSAHAVDSSSSSAAPPTSDDRPQVPPSHVGLQNCHETSPPTPDAKTPSLLSSNKTGQHSLHTDTTIPCGQDNREEASSMANLSLSIPKEKQESESGTTSTEEINAGPQQRLGALSPHSLSVLDGLFLPSEPSIEQIVLSADSIHNSQLSSIPPQTPGASIMHAGFSRSTVQRPIISPTPVRANNGARKLNSPAKVSFEVDDVHRTPARRVPIETAIARGTPSFQKTIQLPTGSDQFQPRRFLTMRTPVFMRTALDDPSRSPAKRILVTDLATSPTRGHQAPSSPSRSSLRARSLSTEPRPLGSISARGRSVEPCATILKPDDHGKTKESIFSAVPAPPRTGTKLPFPLIPGHTLSSDPPPSIPEEHEAAEEGNIETKATLDRLTQGNAMSQLRQPSTNSRIPRIGNKPYARPPPENSKNVAGTTTRNTAGAPRASPFQLPYKNNGIGNGNMEVLSTRTDDQHLVGSLKRKRGAEITAPSNPRPAMIRQVVPGILRGKYAPKPGKPSSQVQTLPESSPPKIPHPLKFRKVVDGMLSARYPPVKTNPAQTEPSEITPLPPSPLSELSSSSSEEPDEKNSFTANPSTRPTTETSDTSRRDGNTPVVEPTAYKHSPVHRDADDNALSNRPRRTTRARKPAQQQYVLDIFNGTTSTRPPPARRKPQTRTEGDGFMGMSATALKALTASNTTKNQQTVAALATEVIRKDGLRPESPTVKARTILQKQRDERDMRRREREQRRSQLSEEGLGISDTEGQAELGDQASLGTRADHDDDNATVPQKHHRGPGEEEDYETPERPERVIEPLRLEGVDRKAKPMKQVKWHRGLSTAVYLDEVDPRPKSLSKEVVVRGCLAPTSKDLSLDHLGNLVDIDNRPSPELVMEQIVVKKYLYDNDIEPQPIPAKMTRSKSKKRS